MAKKLRVGVIGSGAIFTGAHLPGWQKLPDCEIVALADISKNALASAGEKAGVPEDLRFADYKEMLKKVELDVVDVCTPNCYHRDPVIAAL